MTSEPKSRQIEPNLNINKNIREATLHQDGLNSLPYKGLNT